jgi:imidazolonepropionase-like amidohydrolase
MLLAGTASADITLVHAGKLLAIPGSTPATNMTIIVEDDRITGVQQGFVEAEDATVIDLRDKFVLPGLMDMHVHLQGELGPENDRDTLKMSDQLMQMRSIYYAMNTLKAGFTTVRDVGSSSQEMYAMRDAINNGWIDGPRIVAAGGVGITGGHADVSGMSPDLMEIFTSPTSCAKSSWRPSEWAARLHRMLTMRMALLQRWKRESPASNMARIRARARSNCSRKPAPTLSPRFSLAKL